MRPVETRTKLAIPVAAKRFSTPVFAPAVLPGSVSEMQHCSVLDADTAHTVDSVEHSGLLGWLVTRY